jgi:hypothetical protein
MTANCHNPDAALTRRGSAPKVRAVSQHTMSLNHWHLNLLSTTKLVAVILFAPMTRRLSHT